MLTGQDGSYKVWHRVVTRHDGYLAQATLLICCFLVLAKMGFQCPPGDGVSVTITDEAIGLSVVEADGGIEITNTSEIPVIILGESPHAEEQ